MAKWERSPGVWQIKIYVGLDIEKKKQFEFFTFKGSFKEAEHEEVRLKLLYSRRHRTSVASYTVAELFDLFMDNHAVINLKEGTQASYNLTIEKRIKPILGHIKGIKLTPLDIHKYIKKATETRLDNKKASVSARTVQRVYRELHTILEWSVQNELIPYSPTNAIKTPSAPQYIPTIMNVEQAVLFLRNAKESFPRQEYLLTLLGIGAGARKSELLSVRWCDIDFGNNTIQMLKSYTRKSKSGQMKTDSSYRTVEVPKFILDEFHEDYSSIKSKNAFIFEGVDYDKYYKYQFKPLLKELGFSPDIRFHDSRHSHASFLLAAGVDIKQISHQLGHSKIGTTMDTYTHLLTTDEVSVKLGNLLEDKFAKTPKKPVKNSRKPQ